MRRLVDDVKMATSTKSSNNSNHTNSVNVNNTTSTNANINSSLSNNGNLSHQKKLAAGTMSARAHHHHPTGGPPKVDLKQSLVTFCYSELINLESICSDSFRTMALNMLKAASMNFSKSTAPIILNLQSLQVHVQSLYEQEKRSILKDLTFCVERNIGGTIVSDFKDDLCIMSFSYIDQNWRLQDRVLRASTRITDILQFISTTLNDYGLLEDTLLNKFTYISNAGQLNGVEVHLSSVSHLIDNCVEVAIFSDGHYDELIQNCRYICAELKLLPQPGLADWIYKFDLITTVMDNVDKFIPGNFSLDEMMPSMCMLKELLIPFREASMLMRTNVQNFATINQVALQYFKLKKILAIGESDSDITIEHKNALSSEMDVAVKLHTMHKLAVFFWPNFRHLKMFSPTERDEIYAEVRRLMELQANHITELDDMKATVAARSQYAEWEAVTEFDQDEVSRYISDKSNYCNEKMLLPWWQEASKRYPKLAHVARSILCIPASVTSLERRPKLSLRPPVDERLLFLHCNRACR